MSSPALKQREATLALLDVVRLHGRLRALKATPAWFRRAEPALARRIGKVLAPELAELLARIERLGSVPTPSTAARWVRRISKLDVAPVLEDAGLQAALHGRRRAIADLRGAGQPVIVARARKAREPVRAVTTAEYSERVLTLIRAGVFTASAQTMGRIAGDVQAAIAQAYAAGIGVAEAAEQLRATFDGLLTWQLRRIARTELNAYANLGSFETLRELGVAYHQWWTALDERVRATHADLHGEVVKVGQAFSNGLRHPGDRSGPLEEWINCRCRPVPWIPPVGEPVPATPFHA